MRGTAVIMHTYIYTENFSTSPSDGNGCLTLRDDKWSPASASQRVRSTCMSALYRSLRDKKE